MNDDAVHDDVLGRLVDRADVDGLIRFVDGACDAREWDRLLATAQACRAAVRTGRQLWPVATLAEYRAALLAPAPWAARVVTDEAGRFALGPLTEVVAQHHTWGELRDVLAPGPARSFVAHERVLRGERLDEDATIAPVLEVPLALEPWEPTYPLARYEPNSARFDAPPPVVDRSEVALRSSATVVDDPEVTGALRALVAPWTEASNGRIDVVATQGDHVSAVGALGVPRARMAELAPADALAWLGWAGASGGAHGRRPGAATGRFGAWWALAAFAGLVEEWPVPADELGAAASELRWFWWDADEPEVGWVVQLAVWDPGDDLAWAFAARDLA